MALSGLKFLLVSARMEKYVGISAVLHEERFCKIIEETIPPRAVRTNTYLKQDTPAFFEFSTDLLSNEAQDANTLEELKPLVEAALSESGYTEVKTEIVQR